MAGFMDFFDTDQARLGMGLLAAAGPRADGAGFGQRLMEGVGSLDSFRKDKASAKYRDQMMQAQEMQIQQAKEEAQRNAAMRELAAKFARPGQAGLAPLMGDASTGMLPSAGRAPVAPSYDYAGYASALAQSGNPAGALAIEQSIAKQGPKFSTAPQYDQNGRAFVLADNGEVKFLDGVKARDELIETDLGGTKGFRTKYSPEMLAQLAKSQSPDSVASNSVTMRGQNMTDARARDLNDITRGEKRKVEDLTKGSQIASFDTMLGTLNRLGTHPGLSRSVGVVGAFPTIPGSESANFKAELDTFQSQAFIPMVSQLKGMGALSDAEGKKLTAAVGALNPMMGEKAFRESIGRITDEMESARSRVSGQPTQPTSKAPMMGQVVGGYKFKGGNPADKANWEKQ